MSIVVNKTRLPVTQWQTESGSVVSISDARKRYAKSLSVALEPIQSGSGDPSPDNIRPISGRSSVTAYRAGVDQSDNPTSVTLSLGQTVYGGSVDLVSGVMTVEKAILTISSALLYGTYDSGTGKGTFWYVSGQPELNSANDGVICNRLRVDGNVNANSSDGLILFFANKLIRWTEQRSLSKTDYNTWLANNPLQVVYRLKEPQTIQLTAHQIEMLMRNNTVWSDAGQVTLEYARIRQ